MNINMKLLYDLLKSYNPEFYISQKDCEVNNVVWLKGIEQEFKTNLLYVCKASDLAKVGLIENQLNVVCLGDIPLDWNFYREKNLNVIIVDSSADINQIYQDIDTFIISQTDFNNSSTKLYNSLLSGKGLQHIVNVAAEVFGSPITISNPVHKILSYSKNIVVKDALWNEIVGKGYNSYDHYLLFREEFRKAEMADNPIILNFAGKNALFTKIKLGEKCVGYVNLLNFERPPFTKNDVELMKLLSKLISIELQKDNLLGQTKGLIYEFLVAELLDSKEVDQKYLQDRINYLDLNLKENLYVLTARRKPDETDSLPFYREILGSLISDSKSVLYYNDLIFLISRKKNKPLSKSNLADALKFLEENKMKAGLSRCFHDISLIRRFYIQSYKAIEIGNRLKQDELLFMYDDYALHHLLDIAAEQSDLKEFCSNSIFDLIEYDKLNNTKFTQTLYVYFTCGCNVSKTAHIFNVHRNSIDYRIKKVEEILNIDLSDAETHFALYSSFKILSFIKDGEFLASVKNSLPRL